MSDWHHMFIFYNHKCWKDIVVNCLLPLICSAEGELDSYTIYFCHDRGDHIKMSFRALIGNHKFNKDKFEDPVRQFISKHPSIGEQGQFPLDDKVFMDYPNNSVVWNIRELCPHQNTKPAYDRLKRTISLVILIEVSAHSADFEEVFSFLVYGHLLALKAMGESLTETKATSCEIIDFIKDMPQQPYNKDVVYSQFVDHLFASNGENLQAIVSDIWKGALANSCGEWVVLWQKACADFFSGIEKPSVVSLYLEISAMLIEHVGFRLNPNQFSRNLLCQSFCLVKP
jgi:hypothetical protein